ncbi:helical backbone metal receptor [Hymenobacter caeli]|uniref:ABC-type Fe3+-hydroxamate transport system substrate-binding protein n=1 Tax=Hymenobacter caeli TaxID=2735894 RepID=A0ABX2FKA6_9BACT|nr:helical backbone metal receptor [Hymenobacter caeli]NRT17392.1 ABC-type Fe3+-hydroxamate transport system substrate-binding protein [Hymenobacter caeli]
MSFTSNQGSLAVTDQLGRRVVVPFPPQRIVSLVPSQTELLFDLGLGKQIEGVTKFCIYPPEARYQATVIGGTKNFDFAKIAACRPDLVIGNKEENYQDGIAQLEGRYPVWMSDVADLAGALRMVKQVGLITNTARVADPMADAIAERFGALGPTAAPETAAYFIWRKPYMVAAAGTFIDDLLRRAGFANVFGALGRYPEITPEQLAAAAPRRILLSSEPYPFQEKHLAELRGICPAARVELVDGEMFSWYGSRLLHTAAYLSRLR